MQTSTRRRFLCLTLNAGAIASVGAWWSAKRQHFLVVGRTARALGSEVSITVYDRDRHTAEAALDAAFAELETVEEVMSLYRPGSQLCRLNQHGYLRTPHPYLVQVLEHAQSLAHSSRGAFDVTVQPLWSVFSDAQNTGRTPNEDELAMTRTKVDWRRLKVSRERIEMGLGMAVTLNGIAQGFAADRAMAALRGRGIRHAMVNAGELGAVGSKPSGEAWTVGIQHPRVQDSYLALARLDGRCLATSGDYATSFTADRRDNHIFDPRTGRSPTELASVSVLAPSAMFADGLSTTLFVLGVQQGLSLLETTAGVDAMFVLKDGRTLTTRGFPQA